MQRTRCIEHYHVLAKEAKSTTGTLFDLQPSVLFRVAITVTAVCAETGEVSYDVVNITGNSDSKGVLYDGEIAPDRRLIVTMADTDLQFEVQALDGKIVEWWLDSTIDQFVE